MKFNQVVVYCFLKGKFLLGFIFLLVVNFYAVAQVEPRLNIFKAKSEIILDGILDEASWLDAQVAKDFCQNFPYDIGSASAKTEVKITYDDQNFYGAAICYDSLPGNYVILW